MKRNILIKINKISKIYFYIWLIIFLIIIFFAYDFKIIRNLCSGICLVKSFNFQNALKKQMEGLPLKRFLNGTIDLGTTLKQIPQHFNDIWYSELNKLKPLKLLADASGEIKYFAKFSKKLSKPYECVVISLGVGQIIWAEKNLSNIYPECHFLAADPTKEINEDLITKQLQGLFVQASVGAETRDQEIENVYSLDGGKIEKKVKQQLGIYDFLFLYNFRTPIDLISIDVEGAEFGILEQIVEYFNQLPVICQINIEVHHHEALINSHMHKSFYRTFDRFIKSGKYALMNVDALNDQYPSNNTLQRMFFVNVVEKICIMKFLC